MTNPTIRQLQRQLGQLNRLLEETRLREKQAKLEQLAKDVQAYDISELELLRAAGFIKPKRTPVKAKFYNPETGQTWSGRGQRPKWIAGKNLDDYRIRESPQPWWPESGKPKA
jgi:DNA-binding protein H-NS